jgi:ABC-type glycerol-3-phosphate transport system permease component
MLTGATKVKTARGAQTAPGVRWDVVLPRLLTRASLYAVLIVLAAVFTVPSYWTLVGSIKTIKEILVIPPIWWPAEPQWRNYGQVFTVTPYWTFFQNTVVIALSSTIGQVLSASVVGYGFARFRFPGQHALFMLVLSTLMLPPELTMVPQFLLFKELGWLDTWRPLIVPNFVGGGAFFIFLFRQFFLTIPFELDDAARIDGANAFQIFWKVVAPLCTPAWAAAAIISFLGHWNDFIHPLIYLNTTEKYTLSLGLAAYRTGGVGGAIPTGEPRDHLLMAASVIMTAPVIVIFFALQRYFIRGIVMSGIKG